MLRAEHQAVGEAGREAEREVDLEVGALDQRPADRLRLQHPHAVELAAAAHHLEEARELVGVGDGVGGGDDPGQVARVVGQLDEVVERRCRAPGSAGSRAAAPSAGR